jgi:hypothetical protein
MIPRNTKSETQTVFNFTNMDSKKRHQTFKNVVLRQKTVIKTLQRTNDALSKTLEEEMQYKNHAYFFILEKGYFYEYLEYSKENKF